MRPLTVYITGPLSPEGRGTVAAKLRQVGHSPTFEPGVLPTCDAVIRLPGESAAADSETARAHALHIPVFLSLEWFMLKHEGPQ